MCNTILTSAGGADMSHHTFPWQSNYLPITFKLSVSNRGTLLILFCNKSNSNSILTSGPDKKNIVST